MAEIQLGLLLCGNPLELSRLISRSLGKCLFNVTFDDLFILRIKRCVYYSNNFIN